MQFGAIKALLLPADRRTQGWTAGLNHHCHRCCRRVTAGGCAAGPRPLVCRLDHCGELAHCASACAQASRPRCCCTLPGYCPLLSVCFGNTSTAIKSRRAGSLSRRASTTPSQHQGQNSAIHAVQSLRVLRVAVCCLEPHIPAILQQDGSDRAEWEILYERAHGSGRGRCATRVTPSDAVVLIERS